LFFAEKYAKRTILHQYVTDNKYVTIILLFWKF